MATVPVTLHTAAFIDEADGAYTLGGRAAYKMLVNISDANQTTTDAAKGAALTLSGMSAVSWSRVNGIDGTETVLGSPPTGMTLEIGPVTPDNVSSGKRYLAINTTPPGADHPTRWVGWATLGTVFTGEPATPSGIPPNFSSPGTGLAVLIFANLGLSGVPVVQRTERPRWATLNNDAATLLPGTGITGGPDMSVSARGSFKVPATGTYRIVFSSDDGCRFFADGVPIIDDWTARAADRISGELNWTAGQIVNVRAENFNAGGNGRNKSTFLLDWQVDGAPAVPIPTSVMYPIGWDTPLPEVSRPVQAAYGVDYVKRYF